MTIRKGRTLDDLDAPGWFLDAAADLNPAKPGWAKERKIIALRDGNTLPPEASAWIYRALAHTEAECAKHDLVDLLKRHADPGSLDAWVASTFHAWFVANTPARDAWVFTGAGMLGGNATVSVLRDAIQQWTKAKDRTRAVLGLDALARIGTTAAVEEAVTLSAGVRDHSVKDEAKQMIVQKARAEGISQDTIEDRHVSDCGLGQTGERILDYGTRRFRAVLEKGLDLALLDEDGRRRISLPPVSKTDDPALAQNARTAWAEMKVAFKRVLKAQLKRLEQAMITGRAWSMPEVRQFILEHPILSRVAQSLIWQTTEDPPQTIRITEDRTFADVRDDTVSLGEGAHLRIAHPLRLSAEALNQWQVVFADYEIVQPFQQLMRQVHHCGREMAEHTLLTAPPHAALKPGVLYGILDNDGWRLGTPRDSHFRESWKSFIADDVTAVISYSGLITGAISSSPEQVIQHCSFHRGARSPADTGPFGQAISLGLVPPVAFSETMRRLLRLTGELS